MLTIFGYHNEDLIVDLDLTKVDARDILIYQEGCFKAKKDAFLLIKYGSNVYRLQLDFAGKRVPGHDGKIGVTGKLEPQNNRENIYYTFISGKKYGLKGAISRIKEEDAKKLRDNPNVLVLPARAKQWGGGGLNLARTIRSLSPKVKTPVRYVDMSAGNKIQEFNLKYKKSKSDDFSTVADLLAEFQPENCLESFLASLKIDYAFLPTTAPLNRFNLVLSKITDGSNCIGDRIILVSPPGDTEKNNDLESEENQAKLDEIFQTSETVVVNTINHYEMFRALINAWSRLRGATMPKLLVAFTEKNCEWLANAINDKNVLWKKCAKFRNDASCIFNETEFYSYLKSIPTKQFQTTAGNKESLPMVDDQGFYRIDQKGIFQADNSPNIETLPKYLTVFKNGFGEKPSIQQNRIYITFGKHGSVGVDENNKIFFTGTYPTRGVNVYDNTGCGDAWFGAIALLEHHRRELQIAKPEENIDEGRRSTLTRFMRWASGVAVAKITNPMGLVKNDEVLSLLDSGYIPKTEVGDASIGGVRKPIDIRTKHCRRIEHADSIDYRQYSEILY